MSFLYGEYEHSIDTKGRLIIPHKLRSPIRDSFIDQFVVTRGFDKEGCLYMFPPNEWHRMEKKLLSQSFYKSKARSVLRLFFSGASIADCDKQGRVLIPKKLLEFAGIEKEVTIVGVSSHLELWQTNKWNEYLLNTKDDYADLAEELMEWERE